MSYLLQSQVPSSKKMGTEVLDLSKLDNVSKLEIDDIYQEERSVKEIISLKTLNVATLKTTTTS